MKTLPQTMEEERTTQRESLSLREEIIVERTQTTSSIDKTQQTSSGYNLSIP